MIKFTANTGKNGERKLLGMGITDKNIEKLKQGMPIHFHGEGVMIPDVDVVLFYGETEEKIVEELKREGMLEKSWQPSQRN